jgi:hypothetical protein
LTTVPPYIQLFHESGAPREDPEPLPPYARRLSTGSSTSSGNYSTTTVETSPESRTSSLADEDISVEFLIRVSRSSSSTSSSSSSPHSVSHQLLPRITSSRPVASRSASRPDRSRDLSIFTNRSISSNSNVPTSSSSSQINSSNNDHIISIPPSVQGFFQPWLSPSQTPTTPHPPTRAPPTTPLTARPRAARESSEDPLAEETSPSEDVVRGF